MKNDTKKYGWACGHDSTNGPVKGTLCGARSKIPYDTKESAASAGLIAHPMHRGFISVVTEPDGIPIGLAEGINFNRTRS